MIHQVAESISDIAFYQITLVLLSWCFCCRFCCYCFYFCHIVATV